MTLTYHQAAFDLLLKKPRATRRAAEILARRERELGFTFPASLKEFYTLSGAADILEEHSNEDPAVPIEELGDPDDLAHGYLRIQSENQGVVEWYVHLDGSDDPPVVVEHELDRVPPPEGVEDWTLWDVARPRRVTDRFSEYVYQRVLTYGGGKHDRKSASALKAYGASVDFDEEGRATEAYFHQRSYINGKPEPTPNLGAVATGHLRRLDRLRSIRVRTEKIDPKAWSNLSDHPSLVRLDVGGSLVDAAVEHLIPMPALREIQLSDARLTDGGLDRLLRGHAFRSLEIGMSDRITSAGLSALVEQTTLESLGLDRRPAALDEESLAGLSGLASLRRLDVTSPEGIRGDGLRYIAGLVGLERLHLYLAHLKDEDLRHLAGLVGLKALRIGYTDELSGEGLRYLARLVDLEELDLTGRPITDEALVHLGGLSKLRRLELRETKVMGPGLRHLVALRELQELNLRFCELVDEGMPHLAALPSLERLDIAGTRITEAGLQALAPLRPRCRLDLDRIDLPAETIRDFLRG